MTTQYDSHIINVLIKFYLDDNCQKIFHDQYGTWMVARGHNDEYFYMMMRTDGQVAELLEKAKAGAKAIKDSPLAKAMSEDL